MDVLLLIGRVLFALTFLISPSGVIAQAPRVAGSPAMRRFPTGLATFLIRVTCVEAMLGAALIALGLWPDVGALLVLGFLVPVTLTMHRFWETEPSLARKQRRDVFLNNVALAGAALFIFAVANQAQDIPFGLLTEPLFGRL
jgi:uncharacterized membrane protein YphA (DoxX/SURF4 family)